MKTSLSAFGLSLVAFFIPFGFVFDVGILGEGTFMGVAFSAFGLLISTALWAIAFVGWCVRPLALPIRAVIGAAGLAAVIAPSGSFVWLGGLIVGWAIVLSLILFGRGNPTWLSGSVFAKATSQ